GAGEASVAAGCLDARRRRGDAAAAEGVLVATGAADAGSLGTRLVATLLDADASVTLTVVRGPEAAPLPANRRLRVVESPATLADLLAGAAVYAGAAGTTAVQAACVGTPAVVTATVDNQQAQAVA